MFIYDSARRKKVLLEELETGKITIYVCGPTVYDDAHLGHARSAIAFDLLRRVLEASGYEVIFVKNFTDIDDKIIAKMNQTGQSLEEITEHFILRYKADMQALHVKDATIEPRATQSLDAIIGLIQKLLDNGAAYILEDGVYFDTTKDSDYLSLSHQHIEEAKARIQGNDAKKNPKDFALWKRSDTPPNYPSPFGLGRPGWHIECSAMIDTHIAHHDKEFQIDIHAGGADLLFPHHENEAAQTRCASGQNLAKYWMHNGFVNTDGQKMSKSLGNSFFIKDALKVYDGEILRFYLLSTHYRADFNFNEIDLLSSKRRLDKLYRLKKRLFGFSKSNLDIDFKKSILEALHEDLNISKALAILDETISKANESLDLNPRDKALKSQINGFLNWTQEILGIGLMDPFAYFQLGVTPEEKTYISNQINARQEAKKAKDFTKADAIREELIQKGISLMDTPEGTQWEKVVGA
jgi:cysteinyl-tRNA synthetase